MKKIIGSIVYILFYSLFVSGQYTPLLSQYHFNGLTINPAFAGSYDVLSVSISDRNQWVGFNGAPVTQTIAAHMPLKNENIALGLLMYRDVIGVSQNNGIYGNYAYRIKVGDGKLSIGIGGGIAFKQANLSETNIVQVEDVVFSKNSSVSVLPNVSIGAYYYTKKYYLGISSPFIFSEEFVKDKGKFISIFDFSKNNMMLNGGYKYNINAIYCLKPSILFKSNFSSGTQLDLILTAEHSQFGGFGLGFRTNESILFLIKVRFNDQIFLGYSYDLSTSKLSNFNSGTHEIYLTYQFIYHSKTVSSRFF